MLDHLGNLGPEIVISSQLQPLDPVPTDNPSLPISLRLQLTRLWGTCPTQLFPLHMPSQGQRLTGDGEEVA